MSEHSPEPWTSDVSDGFASIRSDGGPNIVAGDGWYDCEDERWEARIREDYRRIVACVNLCAGIPTEEIEKFVALRSTIVRIQSSGCKTNSSVLSLMQEITARQILGDRGYKIEDPHE